jgi:hypothetical protein
MNGMVNIVPNAETTSWHEFKVKHNLDALIATVHWGKVRAPTS